MVIFGPDDPIYDRGRHLGVAGGSNDDGGAKTQGGGSESLHEATGGDVGDDGQGQGVSTLPAGSIATQSPPITSNPGSPTSPAIVEQPQLQEQPDEVAGTDVGTRSSRRAQKRRVVINACLCGMVIEPESEGAVKCYQPGCETIWVSQRP
jgi:hypothetical protein